MDDLFTKIFGDDYFSYYYDNCKCSIIDPIYSYNHDDWEVNYATISTKSARELENGKKQFIKEMKKPKSKFFFFFCILICIILLLLSSKFCQ